ncbi:hypothetical protein R6Z07F_007956 [Ovis aries]
MGRTGVLTLRPLRLHREGAARRQRLQAGGTQPRIPKPSDPPASGAAGSVPAAGEAGAVTTPPRGALPHPRPRRCRLSSGSCGHAHPERAPASWSRPERVGVCAQSRARRLLPWAARADPPAPQSSGTRGHNLGLPSGSPTPASLHPLLDAAALRREPQSGLGQHLDGLSGPRLAIPRDGTLVLSPSRGDPSQIRAGASPGGACSRFQGWVEDGRGGGNGGPEAPPGSSLYPETLVRSAPPQLGTLMQLTPCWKEAPQLPVPPGPRLLGPRLASRIPLPGSVLSPVDIHAFPGPQPLVGGPVATGTARCAEKPALGLSVRGGGARRARWRRRRGQLTPAADAARSSSAGPTKHCRADGRRDEAQALGRRAAGAIGSRAQRVGRPGPPDSAAAPSSSRRC